eukprot:2362724-Rhodomonas_salina.1
MQGLWQPVQEHARVAFNCDYLMEHVPEDRLHFHVAAGMWHEPRQTLETLQWVLSEQVSNGGPLGSAQQDSAFQLRAQHSTDWEVLEEGVSEELL